MAQYLMHKMEKYNVHQKLKQFDYAKINCVLGKEDLDFIKRELMTHANATNIGLPPVSKNQITNFRILHNHVREMNKAGTPFLHNWLNTLVNGVFHEKLLYEAFYFQSIVYKNPREWENCDFHMDLEDAPSEWNFGKLNDKGPITIYFPVGEEAIQFEIEYSLKTRGRPREKLTKMVHLAPGDILLFNTTQCRHRTARKRSRQSQHHIIGLLGSDKYGSCTWRRNSCRPETDKKRRQTKYFKEGTIPWQGNPQAKETDP